MDRGKKPLEKVGKWTTVHKRPNKGKTFNRQILIKDL
ncbi:hypothetical protein Gotur_018848 [Gossypium turneri]